MINLDKITKNGKALFLAYDQGMEHGTADFDGENIDPEYILELTNSELFTGLVLQKGIAEKYYSNTKYEQKVPLILKLNGKTNLNINPDPYSPQICTPQEALDLGASAVGYTVYVGSSYESKMFEEFGEIIRISHELNLPVVGWMYLAGSQANIRDKNDLTAYAARIGLELGADIIKIKYPGNEENLRWAIEAAGKTKVVVSGGIKENQEDFLKMVDSCMQSGCIGMAIGRNIWQSENPLELTKKISNIIWR